MKILIVDDRVAVRRDLVEVLARAGFQAVEAGTLAEGRAALAANPIACAILPAGEEGLALLGEIRTDPRTAALPVVLVSTVEDRRAVIAGLAQGADDVIANAADDGLLVARIQALLRFEDAHRREHAEALHAMTEQLQRANRELESFSYSVSHDLRAPLRAISGFASIIAEDYGPLLDDTGVAHIERIVAATKRMDAMISDMMRLARVAAGELHRAPVDLTAIVQAIGTELEARHAERMVELVIAPGVRADADADLLRSALEQLMSNAWKFTRDRPEARIEFGTTDHEQRTAYFVRDNGVGFAMTGAEKLFRPFQRLHTAADFEGTGIGLAVVQRVIARHGGRVWADGVKGEGATFYFTV